MGTGRDTKKINTHSGARLSRVPKHPVVVVDVDFVEQRTSKDEDSQAEDRTEVDFLFEGVVGADE